MSNEVTMAAAKTQRAVVFVVGGQRLAVELGAVERIVQAVAVTKVPHAPTEIIGVINVHGAILPVLDLRRQLELAPPKEIELSDGMILALAAGQQVVLWVDGVHGVVEYAAADRVPVEQVLPAADRLRTYFKGAVKLDDEIVLIYNPEAATEPLLSAAVALESAQITPER
jgi:purine-binding chemotaxis protein CheW